jgi:LacI family transcriptional regulator
MTCFSHGQADEERLVTRMVQERRADAIILMNLGDSDGFIRQSIQRGAPIVLIDRPVNGAKVCSISMDNEGGAESATKHLIEHGYKRIALLAGPADSYDAVHRLKGYKRALKETGIPVDPELIWPGAFTEESGREAMQRWLDDGNVLPDAIFATNDPMAFGVLDVLQERGLHVPDDVKLVGFDDDEATRHLGLTSVGVPMREMGRVAAASAIQQILTKEVQPRRVLATKLVVRRSCGCKNNKENQIDRKGE